jgi:predicted O-methyltransferase YrrM
MERLRRRLVPTGGVAHLFPTIEDELGPYRHLFRGRVLNAGAGDRDLSPLVEGELVNQDIPHGLHPGHIDIWSPLEDIPVEDATFDAIVCNAVLEHVMDPEQVIAEFARVLKPGGVLYLGVPFMQPEHKDPTDSQRYTIDGLRALCDRHGLDVEIAEPVHSVETTFGWLLHDWLQAERRLPVLLVGRLVYAWLSRRAATSKHQVHSVASVYRAVAIRRGEGAGHTDAMATRTSLKQRLLGDRGSAPVPAPEPGGVRSRRFREDPHGRFWWHTLEATDYEPPIYSTLNDEEWAVMQGWYEDTQRGDHIGEINVPAMSFIHGLVMGNGVNRIVQLGHYFGYSSLLLGFALRKMGGTRKLASIDIDPEATAFTQKWIDRAGLGDVVELHLGDSAAESSRDAALGMIGGEPELVLLDSSHAYGHTLRELDLWMPRLTVGAMALLHDASKFAQSFDPTKEGGVKRAVEEWIPNHPEIAYFSLNGHHPAPGVDGNDLVYKDGCGLGIMQRLPGA